MLKEIDYVIWQEGKHFVSQCLNVNRLVAKLKKSINFLTNTNRVRQKNRKNIIK